MSAVSERGAEPGAASRRRRPARCSSTSARRAATTRSELVEVTGLSRATLATAARAADASPAGRDRSRALHRRSPAATVRVQPAAPGVILGADLGATHGTIAVADLAGRPHRVARGRAPDRRRSRARAHRGARPLRRAPRGRSGTSATTSGPPASASPVPSTSPAAARYARRSCPGWDDFDIPGWFAERLPGPSLVDNDVNVMALGEYWRSWLDDVDTLLYVKVGTGIGAGLVVGGAVFRGAAGAAGDIGHVRVDSPKPVVCDCGNENCLEAVASGALLARDLRDAGLDTADTREVVERAGVGETPTRSAPSAPPAAASARCSPRPSTCSTPT